MSVDYKAIVFYGYRLPEANRKFIPDELFDDYCIYQNAYTNNSNIFFGIDCGSTETERPLDEMMEITDQEYEQLIHLFHILPAEAKKNVDPHPKYWLIRGVW